jgi:hypothetical protein
VRLKADRASLAEYSAVAGLWCEVQVQTILNHAWAEMAHDTIYKKPDLPGGFGASLMQSIEDRMADIMRKHLIPAGYEFQKVLDEFERLAAGKKLFDRGSLKAAIFSIVFRSTFCRTTTTFMVFTTRFAPRSAKLFQRRGQLPQSRSTRRSGLSPRARAWTSSRKPPV